LIFHILKKSDWEEALRRGEYQPGSLATEGFVHASTREQILGTANRFFRGQRELVLLCINPQRLTAEVRFEAPADPNDERTRELFPHIYGPINLDAATQVLDLPDDSQGGFQLPEALGACVQEANRNAEE